MCGSDSDILILVSVAPIPPYQELFSRGPEATWMRDQVPGVRVEVYGGEPMSSTRRQVGDLREMLRFPGAHPQEIGTVDGSAPLLKAYGRLAALADASESAPALRKILGRAASKGILGASHLVSLWERTVSSAWKNRMPALVTRTGDRLLVHQPSTIGNSLAIQHAVIRSVAHGRKFKGALFVTSSAYVDQAGFRDWASTQGDGVVVGGTHALANRGEPKPFLSGFCQYFSWEALQILAAARDLDHSLPNDGALTKWLLARGIEWSDPGIEWFAESMNDGRCPMCADPSINVVRCTSHGSRWREAELMRQLYHVHER